MKLSAALDTSTTKTAICVVKGKAVEARLPTTPVSVSRSLSLGLKTFRWTTSGTMSLLFDRSTAVRTMIG
jgi:hypothetical protein